MAAAQKPPSKTVQKGSALTTTTLQAAFGTSSWLMTLVHTLWMLLMLWWAVKRVHGCGDDGWIFSVIKGVLWVTLATLATRTVTLVTMLLMKVREPRDLRGSKYNAITGIQIGAIVVQTILIWFFSRCRY